MKNRRKYVLIIISFSILSILSSLLFIKTHVLFSADDMEFHLKRVMELKYALIHFNFIPQYGINFFHGSAVMSMYPFYSLIPLCIITFFVHSYINAYYLFFILTTLITLCISFFSSLNYSQSYKVSYLFSVLYGMSSSFVMMMFTNGDLGVITSLAFLPMAIFGFIDLINHKNSYLKLAIGLSLMLYCQIPSFTITFILLFIWALINIKEINKSTLILYLKAMVLIGLLTSIVWIPLLHISLLNNINSVTVPAYLQGVNLKEFIKYISIFSVLAIIICPFYLKVISKLIKQMYWLSIIVLFISSNFIPWEKLIYSYHLNVLKTLNIFQFSFRFLIIPQILLCYITAELIVRYIFRKHIFLSKIIYISMILIIVLLQMMSQGYLINRRQAQNKVYITNYQKPKTAFMNRLRYVVPRSKDSKYLLEGYLGMIDYYPKSSSDKANIIDDNIGVMNKKFLVKFHHIGNNMFNFKTDENGKQIQLPLLKYNNENMNIYVNSYKKHYKVRNGTVIINNIKQGNHKLYIQNNTNTYLIILELMLFVVGVLWSMLVFF